MYNASKVVSSGSSMLKDATIFCSVCGQYTEFPSDEMTGGKLSWADILHAFKTNNK